MSEDVIAWIRVVVVAIVVLAAATLCGFLVHNYLSASGAPLSVEDSNTLAQIQKRLTGIEKRLGDLENRRKPESARALADERDPEAPDPSQTAAARVPRPHYQVSPESALSSRPASAQAPVTDPTSAERLARLQRGVGTLEDETNANREAWQATTDRLAEVAGELGAQHGQILRNQDELNQFLGRTERTALTFELRRGSEPESVGPIRISLKASNQKSQRYTVCVYLQNSCMQLRDRVQYEVVQLAVSRDAAPLELIATKVERDGIVGYLEVPRENSSH